ncbi:putative actin-binding protein Fragmin [Calycina marina]|uniref:Actin-binding protein Fragmin n=1 Tax=Calycina marina TaxID=1763456 RepID=A0A9P8CFX3_9HELO|nr:putative actin-binding protein Fragmin [Calycina marina]
MGPHEGLLHLKEYDIKDSNVEQIGNDIDHRVKYASAATEPAWDDGIVGKEVGLFIWRIEDFIVVGWPNDKAGEFHEGDSYIILHSYKVGEGEHQKLQHEIYFWLGSKTTQDEAGTAAYKTVELDEFLKGATQHREIQQAPSDAFLTLFPQLKILGGGVKSGFTHVEEAAPQGVTTLLRIFKLSTAIMVVEVELTWKSLDDGDVFVLDSGQKIWVWQGGSCSPMEKAKAAQVVHEMTLAKHIDVEVISQLESRSQILVGLLGGQDVQQRHFQCARPVSSIRAKRPSKLLRFSDASGSLLLDVVKDGQSIKQHDLESKNVFLLDIAGSVWVWKGKQASQGEKATWLRAAQMYIKQLQDFPDSYFTPLASVTEGSESSAFLRAVEVS